MNFAGGAGLPTVGGIGFGGSFMTRLNGYVNERNAAWVAVVLAILAGMGDAATGAEVVFTLVYLVPISILSWFRGRRGGLGMAGWCVVSSGLVRVSIAPVTNVLAFGWNLIAEATIFVSCSSLVASLRSLLDREVRLRVAATQELRHAERLNTLGKLAAGGAHELGTPLNVIMGRADLIARGLVDDETARASAVIIHQQGERMERIVRGLLDFGHRGGTDSHPEELLKLCQDTADLLRSLAKTRGVEITVRGRQLEASVNRGELQQVIGNLLSNAVYALRAGGNIEISVSEVNARVLENDDRRPRPYAMIGVRDSGTGIPAEHVPHLFEPFFTTRPVGEGTGLGLSVAYGIVRDHGGAIQLRTKLGEGTTFFVYLPL